MSTARALLPALGVGFAFTLPGAGEKLAFAPEEGSALSKTFVMGGQFELDELSLIVSGQDVGGMLGQIEVSMEQETRIEITDTYAKVADGRPLELVRSFDALSTRFNMSVSPAEVEMPEFESSSPLEGKSVAFKWNEEKQEYERSFRDGEGEEALLEDLLEDMDLRTFLPAGEVAPDGTWTVELAEIQSAFMPGGNLRFEPEGMEVDEEAMKMFEEIFGDFGADLGDLLEGECKCTFKGAREEGAARVAEIEIELEVAASLDLASLLEKAIRAAIEQQGVGESFDLSIDTADLNFDFEGSGTLLWDLGANRVHSLQIGGDVTIDMDFGVSVEVEGESQKVDASIGMSGSLRQDVTTAE
jgi:hypothetical protein